MSKILLIINILQTTLQKFSPKSIAITMISPTFALQFKKSLRG